MARRRFSIRTSATLIATLVTGFTLLAGSLGLITVLDHELTANVESTAWLESDQIMGLYVRHQLTGEIPVDSDDLFAQIVSPKTSRVLYQSTGRAHTERPLVSLRPTPGAFLTTRVDAARVPSDRIGLFRSDRSSGQNRDPDGFPYLVLVRRPTTAGPILIVAASLEAPMQTRDTVSLALAIAVPVLMALAAAAAWILVGRSLKPVEDIRAQVADISGSDLHRRVPVPASRDEIGRLAVTMNAMLDRLESSARRQRRFVADASHELRSPIAVIRAQLEVALGERKDPPDWPEVARSALAHADRLVELIEHLLIMARSVDGSHPSRPRPPVDLDELILSELDRLPNPTGVDIDASRVSAGRVDGDPELLRRMTTNLLANGTRHARSRLRVELQRRHGWVEFVVSDDGPGVAPGDRESVFEPFTRLDEGRSRDAGGSGLGLAIVKEVVIAHGGTVRLEDARPGARFVVRLPQSEDAHGGQPEYGRGKLAHHFRRSRSLSQP